MNKFLTTTVVSAALALVTAWTPVLANYVLRFQVYLDDKPIGEHSFRIADGGDMTRVSSRAAFDVDFLFINAYRYRHNSNEVFRDGCLAEIDASTDDNGKQFRVAGSTVGDAFRIERTDGDGSVDEPLHDLVVLSVGMQPGTDPRSFVGVYLDKDGFIRPAKPKLDTTRTSVEGLFATGTAIAPKDIVDSVVEASAAAAKVEAYLATTVGARPQKAQPLVSVSEMGPEQLVAAGAIEEVHHGQ